jgi:hypothetical protein
MDADKRHQLRTNELADALASLRDLKSPHFIYAGAALAVILIGVAGWLGWRYSQRVTAERDWKRLTDSCADLAGGQADLIAQAQAELRAMIQARTTPVVRGYARLELARSRVTQGMTQPEERQAAFAEAVSLLEELRGDPEVPAQLDAAGTFLLASTHESLRQLDRAKELYRALAEDARYAGSPYQDLAEMRLADVDTLGTPVVFTPGDPPPPPPPATQPMTLMPELVPGAAPSIQAAPAQPTLLTPVAPAPAQDAPPPAPEPSAETDVPAPQEPTTEKPQAEEPATEEPAEQPAPTPDEPPTEPGETP